LEQFFRFSNPKYLLEKGYFLIRQQHRYLKATDLQPEMTVEIEGNQLIFEAKIGNNITDKKSISNK
jgi:hypothetical protein